VGHALGASREFSDRPGKRALRVPDRDEFDEAVGSGCADSRLHSALGVERWTLRMSMSPYPQYDEHMISASSSEAVWIWSVPEGFPVW